MALGTQKCDTECDPGALEDEQPDVVDRVDVEGDRDDQAGRCHEGQNPGASETSAEARREQQLADEKEPDAEPEEHEVVGYVACERRRDRHLHDEEGEQHDPRNRYAPPDASDPRAHEPTKAPDRHDEGREPDGAESDIDASYRVRRRPEGDLPRLAEEDEHPSEDRGDTRAD